MSAIATQNHARQEHALKVFTSSGAGPKTTFPLVLASVSVAVLSMWLDAVPKYSTSAFVAGVGLTLVLSAIVGTLVDGLRGSFRLFGTLLFPTIAGAFIGMVVQACVLNDVGTSWVGAVRDLGGLVDTATPVPWILAGIVLGGLPALAVTVFLLLASRAIKKLTGHDASEGFGVAFTGGAGVFAAFGLVLVDDIAIPPLFVVIVASTVALMIALLIDGSRIALLRRVYAGQGDGFDIVPIDQFAGRTGLAPVVANAGAAAVLVRLGNGSYRDAAAEPIAFVGTNETETLRPLLRRRIVASCMLVAMALLGGLSFLAHH